MNFGEGGRFDRPRGKKFTGIYVRVCERVRLRLGKTYFTWNSTSCGLIKWLTNLQTLGIGIGILFVSITISITCNVT